MKEKNERFVEKLTEGKSLSELGSRTVLVDTETGVNYLFGNKVIALYGTFAEE